MFQGTSAMVQPCSTIGLVLSQIELRDNITRKPDCHCGTSCQQDVCMASPAVTPLQMLSSNGFLGVYQLTSISDIIIDSCRGSIYIVPLLNSVLMLSPLCSSEVTLLERNYASSCVLHRLRPRVRQIHQTSSDFTCSITRSYSMPYWYPVGTSDNNDNS